MLSLTYIYLNNRKTYTIFFTQIIAFYLIASITYSRANDINKTRGQDCLNYIHISFFIFLCTASADRIIFVFSLSLTFNSMTDSMPRPSMTQGVDKKTSFSIPYMPQIRGVLNQLNLETEWVTKNHCHFVITRDRGKFID